MFGGPNPMIISSLLKSKLSEVNPRDKLKGDWNKKTEAGMDSSWTQN